MRGKESKREERRTSCKAKEGIGGQISTGGAGLDGVEKGTEREGAGGERKRAEEEGGRSQRKIKS